MARPRQSGLHDPFWYEATVAERFIVEMLDPDSGIQSVTMQAPGVSGIDDVVVKYHAKPTAYHQIKHTRVDETLSFADLTNSSEGLSLLRQLAEGWRTVTRGGSTCETHLFTNRALAIRSSRTAVHAEELPALAVFWPWLKKAVMDTERLEAIETPDEWQKAWQRWLAQLESLTPAEQVGFLKSLRVDAGEPNLPALAHEIVRRLAGLFGIPEETAERALAQLDHALRDWATSERGVNVDVTPERAWSALAMGETEMVGDHAFPPPAPFFPSREKFLVETTKELRQANAALYFLTGPAGCGKSSVVSALANRTEPIVDLRFHAFRPLTPHGESIPEDAGRAVTAAALWGDLLVQLRTYFFRGRLWRHRVPVRNDFLLDDPVRLREHVLRLATVLAKERQRPTVIAIDGLDHAARARHLTPEVLAGRLSLLASLVPPDEVPPGIVFLIAGQPGWEAYPSWLRTQRPDVHVVDVPPIDESDIAALLRANPGAFPEEQIEGAARVIANLTRGNTLPAVYAAAETQSIADTVALQTHLEGRRLGASLEEYYGAIWSGALNTFQSRSPATGRQVATALALSTARLTPQLLRGFFPDASLSIADWEVILGNLAPIVDVTAGTYAIRHNDLRVFLMAQLQGDRRSLVSATSAMATYYLGEPASEAKHADLLRLLDFAERQTEIPAVFSSAFVADAVALHRPVTELLDQAKVALASVTDVTPWNDVHTLALGLATAQQARTIVEYYSLEQTSSLAMPPYLGSEARVLPRREWSLHAIERLYADARMLLSAGESARARALMRRWLGDLSPVALASLLEAQPGTLEPWERDNVEKRIREIIRVGGELAQSVGVNRATLTEPVTDASSLILATFYGGWLRAGVKVARPWPRTLQMPPVWWDADVEACVEELAREERWGDVLATFNIRRVAREQMSLSFRVRAAEWAIRAHAPDEVVTAWIGPVADEGFAALTALGERYDLELLDLYVPVACAIGFMHVARPSGGVSDEGATAYFTQHYDRRTDEHVRRLLYAAAWTGKFLRSVHSRRFGEALLVQEHELAAVVKSLLSPAWDQPAFVPPAFLVHAPRLIGLILGALTEADHHIEPALVRVLLAYAAERQATQPLEIVWRALAARGYRDVIEGWMQEWIGDEGRVWNTSLGERFAAIVRRFAALAREVGWAAEADRAEERLRWNQLGYTGHKDYSLSLPLRWFEDLAERDLHAWDSYGVRLLAVSNEASRTGDNQAGWQIDGAVATAAARCGPAALWRLAVGVATARSQRFVLEDAFVLEGIEGALEHALFRADELCDLWCLAIGMRVWETESGRTPMAYLRGALLRTATRLGLGDVPARLHELAPFEFVMPGSRYGDPTTSPREALEANLRAIPIGVAIHALSERAHATERDGISELWQSAEVCGERLRQERPSNFVQLVEMLVAILQCRGEGHSWSFGSFGRAVAAVVPLLSEATQREFRTWTIQMLDTADSPDIWLVAASDNLRTLVRLHALRATTDDLRAGLASELCTHETWILGPSHENRRRWPSIEIAPRTSTDPSDWASFAFHGLIDLLGSRSSARCRAAIKGLFALLATREDVNGLGMEIWTRLDRDRRHLLVTLLERLATEHPQHFDAWRPLVEAELHGAAGAEQLQAWVTLDAFARATGVSSDQWKLPSDEPHQHGSIVHVTEEPRSASREGGTPEGSLETTIETPRNRSRLYRL